MKKVEIDLSWTLESCKVLSESVPHTLMDAEYIFSEANKGVKSITLFVGDVYRKCLAIIKDGSGISEAYEESVKIVKGAIGAISRAIMENEMIVEKRRKSKHSTLEAREIIACLKHANDLFVPYLAQLEGLMNSGASNQNVINNNTVDEKLVERAKEEFLRLSNRQNEAYPLSGMQYDDVMMRELVKLYKDVSAEVFMTALIGMEAQKNKARDNMEIVLRLISKGSDQASDEVLCASISLYLQVLKKYQYALCILQVRNI